VTPLQSPSLTAEKWHIFNRNVIDTKRIPILVVFGGVMVAVMLMEA